MSAPKDLTCVIRVSRPQAAGASWLGPRREDAGYRVVLRLRHPQAVRALHRDLPGDVGASVRLVRRQPGGRVAVALRLVGAARRPRAAPAGRWRGRLALRGAAAGRRSATRRPGRRRGRSGLRRRRRAARERDRRGRCRGRAASRRARRSRGARLIDAVRSRRRMSLRVSQPLWPCGSSLSSVQAGRTVAAVAGHRGAALDRQESQHSDRSRSCERPIGVRSAGACRWYRCDLRRGRRDVSRRASRHQSHAHQR